jgi:ribosome-binding protein aMBF1 (putative translation factor)
MIISAAQVIAARELLGWTRGQLARQAKVGVTTVRTFEVGGAWIPRESLIAAMQRALEAAGVEFTEDEPAVKLGQ